MFGPITLVNQSATFTVPGTALSTGQNTLKATYNPDAASAGLYTSNTQSAGVFVTGIVVPVMTLTPSPTVITDQQIVNVAVSLAGPNGGIPPTGTLTLTSGNYTAAESAGGAPFTIPARTLPDGTDTLTVTYSGDQTYAAASGTAIVTVSPVVMGATVPSPVAAGAIATATVTLTAGSYSGTLTLTCALTTSPANAQSPPTCALNPATDTVAAGGNATTTMTLNTTDGTSAMAASKDRFWRSGGAAVTFAVLFLIGLGVRRRRWVSFLGLLVMAICVVSTGYGGGSHPKPPPTPATTAGTYVFTVKAADSKNPAIATSANVSLTVQ
jgi:hypothetical protein